MENGLNTGCQFLEAGKSSRPSGGWGAALGSGWGPKSWLQATGRDSGLRKECAEPGEVAWNRMLTAQCVCALCTCACVRACVHVHICVYVNVRTWVSALFEAVHVSVFVGGGVYIGLPGTAGLCGWAGLGSPSQVTCTQGGKEL